MNSLTNRLLDTLKVNYTHGGELENDVETIIVRVHNRVSQKSKVTIERLKTKHPT